MSIDIQHIARLAHLRIDDDKLADFEKDMAAIVAMVERLPDIDEELLPDSGNQMKLRSDIAEDDKYTKKELLVNAPEVQNGCFSVPKTVE